MQAWMCLIISNTLVTERACYTILTNKLKFLRDKYCGTLFLHCKSHFEEQATFGFFLLRKYSYFIIWLSLCEIKWTIISKNETQHEKRHTYRKGLILHNLCVRIIIGWCNFLLKQSINYSKPRRAKIKKKITTKKMRNTHNHV